MKALKDNLDLQKILEEAPSFELSDSRGATIETAVVAANAISSNVNAISSNANACNLSNENRVRRGHRGDHYRGSSHSVVVPITTDTIRVHN